MIYAAIGAWLLMIGLKFWRLKKGLFDIFWAGLIVTYYGFVTFDVAPFFADPHWLIYAGAFGTVLFFHLGNVIKGQDDSESFQSLNEKYQTLLTQSETLRHRFVGTLEVLDDGMIYQDAKGEMFITEPLSDLFGVSDPEMSEEEYLARVHPDDVPALKEAWEKSIKTGKKYHVKYRIQAAAKQIWVEEKGRSVKADKQAMRVMQVRPSEVRMFPKTDVDVLNYLPQESDLDTHLMTLHHAQNPYSIVAMRLTNIPGINAKYGRDVGDMMMGEFLKKMKYHFIKDDAIYRLQGILFIMLIQDSRKAAMLEKALREDSSLLQTTIDMGGIKESVYPYFGMLNVRRFDISALELKPTVIDALRLSLSEDLQENFTIQEV